MKTVIIKNTWLPFGTGWGNGYVLIPQESPLHGKHYDDIEVDVHGGLTFSQLVTKEMVDEWCKGENGLSDDDIGYWMVGFDTSHYSDDIERWPKEEVQKEADRLANNLTKLEAEMKAAK